MLRFDYDRDALRLESLLDAVADIDRESFLYLQAPCKRVDHPRNLGQPYDMAVWYVGHVSFPEKRQHVMLAQRINFDVAHDDHLLVFLAKHGRAQDFGRVQTVTVREELQRFCSALGRFGKPLALRIFSQLLQNG